MTVSNKYRSQLKKHFLLRKSRNSNRRCSVKEGLCNLLQEDCNGQNRCFPVNIAKLLRTPILENICETLLLKIRSSVTSLLKEDNS